MSEHSGDINYQKDLSEVISNNLCVACGACVAVGGGVNLELNPAKLMFGPSNAGSDTEAAVCPAVGVDFSKLVQLRFPDSNVTALGVVNSIQLAQSVNNERNQKASSGGIIKELLLEYISLDEVTGAIALQHVSGLTFEPTIIRRAEEVDLLPGSIYHNISFAKTLKLLNDNEGRFVVVALPCQLEGLYNFVYKVKPQLAERIYASIGLICGWTYSHHSLRAICEYKGLNFSQINNVSYRGGGPVGNLILQFPDRTVKINRRRDFDYMTAFDRSFNLPRCHLCINHINFLCDIAVGDAWLASTNHTKSGVSIVICRTEETVQLTKKIEKSGKICCAESDVNDVAESQSRNFTFGDFSYAYANYLEEIQRFRPYMKGPNFNSAQLVSRNMVRRFHQENTHKLTLQEYGQYRRLRVRKILVDLRRYFFRYLQKTIFKIFGRTSHRRINSSHLHKTTFH